MCGSCAMCGGLALGFRPSQLCIVRVIVMIIFIFVEDVVNNHDAHFFPLFFSKTHIVLYLLRLLAREIACSKSRSRSVPRS